MAYKIQHKHGATFDHTVHVDPETIANIDHTSINVTAALAHACGDRSYVTDLTVIPVDNGWRIFCSHEQTQNWKPDEIYEFDLRIQTPNGAIQISDIIEVENQRTVRRQ